MKFLVIGLGSMGKRRVRNLLALDHPPSDIFGYDPRGDRCDEAAGKYGIETSRDFDSLTKNNKFDVFIISTPPDLHMKYADKACDMNVHAFIEASVVTDGIPELIGKLKSKPSLVFAPSLTMWFFPGPKQIIELIGRGVIGRPLGFTYHYGQYLPDWHPWESIKDFYVSKRETGGCREIVPFELGWIVKLFGEIKEVSAVRSKLTDIDADIDDIYAMTLKFKNSMIGSLTVETISRSPIRNMKVFGSEGNIEWNNEFRNVRYYTVREKKWQEINLDNWTVEKNYIGPEEPYIEELSSFISAVKGGRKFCNDLAEDLKILNYLLDVERAYDDKRVKIFG